MATVTSLFKPGLKKTATCLVCQRRCLLKESQIGFCRTRRNQGGKITSVTYGVLCGPPQPDPVEKKPLYHFLPGTRTYSLGSFGCNFRCKKCLNWWCSWGEPATELVAKLAAEDGQTRFFRLRPEEVVERTKQAGLPSISFTYNEPTVSAEFVHDTAKLAHRQGVKTIFVTNGSWTTQTLDYLGPYLDAANIDFKSFSEKTARKIGSLFGQIPEMALYAQQKYHLHLEITTVLIPGINDTAEELAAMTGWISKNLGPETPWHLSAFSPRLAPDNEFRKIPAPTVAQLEKAAETGLKNGLKHVYLWAPGRGFERSGTVCPHCAKTVVIRHDWVPKLVGLTKANECRSCHEKLHFVL